MNKTYRSIVAGICCLAFVGLIAGCSSEDAGQTLSVTFTTESGTVMNLTTAGTDATATAAATPDIYTGKGSVGAKVVYRGKKSLVYKWTVAMPAGISATGTPQDNSISLDLSGSTPRSVPLPSGVGSVSLEVYEKDGSLSEKASKPYTVVVGYSG